MNGSGLPHVDDPYIDPITGILRNLVGATTAQGLARFESDLTVSRTIQIQANDLVPHTRDLTELRALHRHLFRDLFDWAGEIRTIDMKRGQGEFFAPKVGIEMNASFVFEALREREYLQKQGRQELLSQLASFYDQLNYIHPFRDGNGRAQRLFWSRVAHAAGWRLDWRSIHGEELNEVSRVAREERDLADLEAALDRCLFPL